MPREDRPRGCLVWLREGRVLQEEGEVGHTGAMSAQGLGIFTYAATGHRLSRVWSS